MPDRPMNRAHSSPVLGAIAFVLTYFSTDFIGRVVAPLAFIERAWVGISIGCVVAVFVARKNRTETSRFAAAASWVLAGAIVLGAMYRAPFLEMRAHLRLGSPTLDCGDVGFDVDSCRGRSWTFLQGRRRFQEAEGDVAASQCRQLIANTSPANETRFHHTARRDSPCVLGRPAWSSEECDARFKEMGYSQCVACSWIPSTNDLHQSHVGLSRDCTRAIRLDTVGMSREAAARCLRWPVLTPGCLKGSFFWPP